MAGNLTRLPVEPREFGGDEFGSDLVERGESAFDVEGGESTMMLRGMLG